MARAPNVTRENFAEYAAQRLAAHEKCSNGAVRAGVRSKLRDLARRLGVIAPQWCMQRERRSDATARERRGGRKAKFGVRASATPRRTKRKARGNGLAVVPAGAMARPLELPRELVAWRSRTEGACVQLHGDGRVTLLAPEAPASPTYTKRTFASVDEAVSAIEAA